MEIISRITSRSHEAKRWYYQQRWGTIVLQVMAHCYSHMFLNQRIKLGNSGRLVTLSRKEGHEKKFSPCSNFASDSLWDSCSDKILPNQKSYSLSCKFTHINSNPCRYEN